MAVFDPLTISLADGGSLRAEVYAPEGDGPFPGVVVMHEIFGMNDDIRRIAGRFADAGYAAIVPDLYSHGNRLSCLSRVLLSQAIDSAQRAVLDDIEATRVALAERDDVDGERIGIIGFCMGGGFALAFAAARPGVRVASVNYGAVPKKADALASVCPVVASYGTDDRPFVAQGKRLNEHLETLGIPHDVKIYEGVGHSFMSYDNSPGWMAKLPSPMHVGYAEAEAEDSWRRIFTFFAEHLTAAG